MNRLSLDGLRDRISAAGAPVQLFAGILRAWEVLAVAGVREHFRNSVSPEGQPWKPIRPRPTGPGKPLSDTGRLLQSVRAQASDRELVLTASHPGAAVHQYGATIAPRLAKLLAIPLTPEAKRIGSPRRNRFPRPLFVLARQGRDPLLCERTGNRLVVQYVLKKRVTIPARPYLGFSQATLDKMERVAADRVLNWIASAFSADARVTTAGWEVTHAL